MPLIDSSQWKAGFIKLNQLRFHPKNPRLPMVDEGASERQIIEALCKRESIDVIAKSIVNKGYLRNERLIVVKEGAKNFVYEGNRRLCALKLLENPSLAPKASAIIFKRLAEKAELPDKIAVEVVPNKFHAEVVMHTKHAGAQFSRDWKPLQQAVFITDMLNGGESIHDVSQAIHISREDIILARSAIDLYKFALHADATPKGRELIEDPTTFPYSILFERMIKPPAVRKMIGVEITDSGLVVTGTQEEFCGFLGKLIDKIAEEDPETKLTTRNFNTVEGTKAYLQKLNYKPSTGRITASDLPTPEVGKGNPGPKPKPKPTKKPGSSSRKPALNEYAFSDAITVSIPQEKLTRMLQEGQSLRIDGAEHASILLMRSFLEISLELFLRRKRVWAHVHVSNPKHGPSLNDMLDFFNKGNHLALEPRLKTIVEALVSRSIRQSKPQLDRITHSPDVLATKDEVVAIRELLEPLLQHLLLP